MNKITAIVSTYNSERFFSGRIENLLGQTVSDRLEIIVIDSGSEQNESGIAEQYIRNGAPIKLLRTSRESLYNAWNRAVEQATGDFLISANTDDRLVPNACEVLASALEERPELCLAFSDAWETEDDSEVLTSDTLSYRPGRRRIFRQVYSHVRLLLECCCGPFPMWRRSVHNEVGYFDPSYVVAGDWEFWLRMAERWPMLHIAKPLGLIAKRAESVLWSNQECWMEENARVRAKYFQRLMPSTPLGRDI